MSYSDFKKCCEKKKKKKKNMKKIRRTLRAHISGTAWWIHLNFGIGSAPPRGNQHRKFCCFCLGSVELQMRENGVSFIPVKYTLVCHAPKVSWATQHTTVCLDQAPGLNKTPVYYHNAAQSNPISCCRPINISNTITNSKGIWRIVTEIVLR